MEWFGKAAFKMSFQHGVFIKRRRSLPRVLVPHSDILCASVVVVNYDVAGEELYKSKRRMLWPSAFPATYEEPSLLWRTCLLTLVPQVAAYHQIIATDDPGQNPDYNPCKTDDVFVEADSQKLVDG